MFQICLAPSLCHEQPLAQIALGTYSSEGLMMLRLCLRWALQVLIKTWHYAGELKCCFYTQIQGDSLCTSCKPLYLQLLPSMQTICPVFNPSPSQPHFCCSVLRVQLFLLLTTTCPFTTIFNECQPIQDRC